MALAMWPEENSLGVRTSMTRAPSFRYCRTRSGDSFESRLTTKNKRRTTAKMLKETV